MVFKNTGVLMGKERVLSSEHFSSKSLYCHSMYLLYEGLQDVINFLGPGCYLYATRACMLFFLNEFTNIQYSLWDHILYLWHNYLPRSAKNVNELFFCLIKYLRPNLMSLHHINIAFNQM